METYEDIAIEGVKKYLINTLENREWCKARRIGKALEILVEGKTGTVGGIRELRGGDSNSCNPPGQI